MNCPHCGQETQYRRTETEYLEGDYCYNCDRWID